MGQDRLERKLSGVVMSKGNKEVSWLCQMKTKLNGPGYARQKQE